MKGRTEKVLDGLIVNTVNDTMREKFLITKQWSIHNERAICLLYNRPVLAEYCFNNNRLQLLTDNLVEPIEAHPMLNICCVLDEMVFCFPDWYDKIIIYNTKTKKTESIDVCKNANIYDVFVSKEKMYAIVTSGNFIIEIDRNEPYNTIRHYFNIDINPTKTGCDMIDEDIYIPLYDEVICFRCKKGSFTNIKYKKKGLGTITSIKHIYGDSFIIVSDNQKRINRVRIRNNEIFVEQDVEISEFRIDDVRIVNGKVICINWNDDDVIVMDTSLYKKERAKIGGKGNSPFNVVFLYQKENVVGFITGDKRIVELDLDRMSVRSIDVKYEGIELKELFLDDIFFREGDPLSLLEYVQIISSN